MATRFVEYVRVNHDKDGNLVPDNRDRHITENEALGDGKIVRKVYHFRKRPDLGEAYADRRICEVENAEHAQKLTGQKYLGQPVFQFAEDLELEINSKPIIEAFTNHPEIVQDIIFPICLHFFSEAGVFVKSEDFETFKDETKKALAKKANAKGGRPKKDDTPAEE